VGCDAFHDGSSFCLPSRGRPLYREFYKGEIECPVVKEVWAVAEEQFIWGGRTDMKALIEYSYKGSLVRVIINPSRRRNRFKDVYGIHRDNAKRGLWKWRRTEDRKQKEQRLRNTWFYLPIDEEDDLMVEEDYLTSDIKVGRGRMRTIEREVRRRERLKENRRDEWRSKMKRSSASPFTSPRLPRSPPCATPPRTTTPPTPSVILIDKIMKMKDTCAGGGGEEILLSTALTHPDSPAVRCVRQH